MATGGGSDEQIEQAGQYGYQVGLAFQVIDDVLDFAGDEAALGKPVGGDLRKGVITLPLIYAVAAGGGDELAAVVDTPDEERIAWAISEAKRLGAIEQTRQEAERLVEEARAHLADFPDTPARQLLYDIAAFTLERDR
jgi:heptaprenyl diphosphate synthase/octaprenyl-diphosphate synthase